MSEVKLYLGDCLEVMKSIPDKSVDAVITDPPYGIGKEEWDAKFNTEFISESFRVANIVVVIPGIWALGQCIQAMGNRYLWTVAGHKPAAMTNGRIGLNKWLPAVIGGNKKRIGADAFDFHPVDEGLVGHSCQKPLQFMNWLVQKFAEIGDTILDPFMGSGTTGVACVQTGRNFIGIEIDPKYYAIAEKRIKDAQQQMRLPI